MPKLMQAALVAALATSFTAAAAVDYFLKIDGIEGEVIEVGHKGEIAIESWSWGVSQSAAASGGGSRAGKPCTTPIHFTKRTDKATPPLMANAVTGMVIPRAILIGRKAGEGQRDFLKVDLKNVYVTSYQTGGAGASDPTDQFSLNFSGLMVEYKPQDEKGTLGGAVSANIQAAAC